METRFKIYKAYFISFFVLGIICHVTLLNLLVFIEMHGLGYHPAIADLGNADVGGTEFLVLHVASPFCFSKSHFRRT